MPPPKPVPDNYREIDGADWPPVSGARFVNEADPAETITVVIHLKASAGQAGLSVLEAFARSRGVVVVATNSVQRSVVLWGTAEQISDLFAIRLNVYEAPAGLCRGWDGLLHLPADLAEIVEGVSGLLEREIENLAHWLGGFPGVGQTGAGGSGEGQGSGTGRGDRPVQVFDLIVPESGPKGAVDAAAFSLVQVFDIGWLLDPGFQRQLDNFAASPGAFKTVRVMKVFTNGVATVTTARPALPNETAADDLTTMSGNVWPAGGPIDFTGTLNALAELTSRGLIPFIVLGFFPDGIYNTTSFTAPLPGPIGPNPEKVGLSAADWAIITGNWTTLVEAFFAALIADPRFGAAAIQNWWFEVWNEPDNDSMWGPDSDTEELTYYQGLYAATCTAVTAAVTAKGATVQLGGPTIMGPNVVGTNDPIPGTTATMMSDFIDFVMGKTPASTTKLQCDFLSFHAKGSWSFCLNGASLDENNVPVANSAPILQAAVDGADQTASFAKAAGLSRITVINDEADMRVLFDVPFRPRMTEQFPAWLTALMIAYDSLASEYAPAGMKFMVGSDDAELPLVGWSQTTSVETIRGEGQAYNVGDPEFAVAAFGQQRSIMTAASTGGPPVGDASGSDSWVKGTCPIDLLKVPVYNFYELLRLLGDQHGAFLSGSSNYYPHGSDLFHIITVSSTHIGSVFCVYPPNPPSGASKTAWPINYSIVGIPWSKINWYQFQIDGTLSNGFNAAGGPGTEPVASACVPSPWPATSLSLTGLNAAAIRHAQELSVVKQATPTVGQPITGGRFDAPALKIPAYTTTMFWITEYIENEVAPNAPTWIGPTPPTLDITPSGTNVVLTWQPSTLPAFYSYEVAKDDKTKIISPDPLRAALWVDTNGGTGHKYWVRVRTASNTQGAWSSGITS
jgi:hypothetical protein